MIRPSSTTYRVVADDSDDAEVLIMGALDIDDPERVEAVLESNFGDGGPTWLVTVTATLDIEC